MSRILPVLICIASLGCAATTTTTTAETTPTKPQTSQVSETQKKSGTTQTTKTTQTEETVVAQGLNCDDSGNLNQSQMNQCARLSYEKDDKKLNQAYQKLRPKLQESRREKLKQAQLRWIEFRDAHCDFERSEVEGGTMAPTIYYGCLAQTTEARTKQLNEYINQASK